MCSLLELDLADKGSSERRGRGSLADLRLEVENGSEVSKQRRQNTDVKSVTQSRPARTGAKTKHDMDKLTIWSEGPGFIYCKL